MRLRTLCACAAAFIAGAAACDRNTSFADGQVSGRRPAGGLPDGTRGARAPSSSGAPAASASAPAPRERLLDHAALERLVEEARGNGSDELVIVKDGELVGQWQFTPARGPIQSMSITKSVLSLAVGTLIDQGKLRLEQPVHEFYPEWRSNEKRDITLLHLLNHTSGLEEGEDSRPIYASKSFVDAALRAELAHAPGTHYKYSNHGANLVSGIIGKVSGMRTDRYVHKALFEPLGIREYTWLRDRAGQPQGLAGLHLLPRDLAKIGELVLGGGMWQGRRVLGEEWVRRSTAELAPQQPTNKRLGLFFWLIADWTRVTVERDIVEGWRRAGADEAFIAKVAPLVDRRFDSVDAFLRALRERLNDESLVEWDENTWKRGVPDARFAFGPIVGTYCAGTLGQYLVVLPRDRLVAVRMRRRPKSAAEAEDASRAFPDFVERIRALIRER